MNDKIRKEAKAKGVKLWQIAESLGITDCTFSRKLRHELPETEQQNILSIINDLANGGIT
ncbi:MAG: hypothetical protein IJV74_05950 [Clostridia bacterium]|nr:hypothetical protein [Clostridia bacterium]